MLEMLKKNLILFIFIFVIIIVIIGIIIGICIIRKRDENMVIEGGVVKDKRLPGYEEIINSKDITFFEYSSGDYYFLCELNESKLHIESRGAFNSKRDGNYFKLDYEITDLSFLNRLQEIVEKYEFSKNNGYEYEVAGLPGGLGDHISVKYESGEKIWKYSNQYHTVNDDASNEIYEIFHNLAKENGYDFNSEGSNTVLYDDASKEYLQGTWVGTHFGIKYKIIFNGNNIKIYEDNKLTDDIEYTIIDGYIVPNKYKNGIFEPSDRYDYEEFNVISTIKKKNDFTIVAYFMKESYSTCELLKQKED